jgi:hypothetical protein
VPRKPKSLFTSSVAEAPSTALHWHFPGGGQRVLLGEAPANEYLQDLTTVRTAGGHYYSDDPQLSAGLADQDRRLSSSNQRRYELKLMMATLHGMESYWEAPTGTMGVFSRLAQQRTVTIPYRYPRTGRHTYYDTIQVVEHAAKTEPAATEPVKVKNKPGRKPLGERALTSKEKNDRWKAKKAAKLHVVEDHNTFYKCDACSMFHRVDFVPGRDVRYENGQWIEPREQWVWGELPEGAKLRSET